jgi:NTP pyrophosphatase (non-canonical NTP hydrolase)
MIYDELLTFGEAQQEVMAHKRRMGFNTTDIETEFGLLMEELGELHNAWRKLTGSSRWRRSSTASRTTETPATRKTCSRRLARNPVSWS